MASAQVMPNSAVASSRKLGHLEAGKRRLEEFRKKKAEGKSKKTASAGQLLSPDVNNNVDRSPSDVDNILRAEASRINATSQISNSVSLNFDGTTDVEFKSKHLVVDGVAELPKDYVTANSVDDDYFLKRDSGLPIDIEIGSKLSDRSSNQEESASHSTFSSSKFEIKNDFVSHEDSSPLLQHWADANSSRNDLSGQHLDVGSQRWLLPQYSSVDSGSTLRNSSAQLPSSSSTSFPAASWRTRSSFHDFLNKPKPSSSATSSTTTTITTTSHSLFSEAAKADSDVPLKSLKFSNPEVHQLSPQRSPSKYFQGMNDPFLSSSDSKNDGYQRKEIKDDNGKRLPDFPISTKDEDFAALEQHIEDLTQEKFSLKRALESSRSLAESLTSENSSLTENYNQQRKIVNELKSEMDHMREEIRSHLVSS